MFASAGGRSAVCGFPSALLSWYSCSFSGSSNAAFVPYNRLSDQHAVAIAVEAIAGLDCVFVRS